MIQSWRVCLKYFNNRNLPEGVLSPADILENAKSASGKFGGVAGVLHGVICKWNVFYNNCYHVNERFTYWIALSPLTDQIVREQSYSIYNGSPGEFAFVENATII